MAAIDALIDKAKAITAKENEQLKKLFHKLFEELNTELSFNLRWISTNYGQSRLWPMIHNHTDRLIFPHGCTAKLKDRQGDSIIVMGTHFGLVVLHAMPRTGEPRYIVTKAFADAWSRGYQVECKQEGFVDTKAPYFFDQQFFQYIDELADMEREAGRTVGDGIPLYVPPPRAAKPARPKKNHMPAVQPLNNKVYS